MEHDGVMIAFYPSPEMALALHTALGGYTDLVAPAEMHMTLVYLGDIPDLEAQGINQEKVLGVLRDLGSVLEPVKGQISGTGRFTNTHLEDKDAIVLLVDSPQLPDFRAVVTNELTAQGIPYAKNHGFAPHITLLYMNKGDGAHYLPPVADIVFDEITLAWGDQKTEVALTKADTVTIDIEEDAPTVVADEGVEVETEDTPSLIEKALEIIRRPFRRDEVMVGFKALGNGWWWAGFTNNFGDLHGDTLAEKAHDRYIARLDRGIVPMPVLDHWHIDGSEHGKALWVGRAGHMVIAIGHYDDTPMGRAAEKHYRRNPGKYKISHKFLYPRWAEKDGVIHDYNTYKISTLPVGAEANQHTGFISIEEDKLMPLSEEKLKSLRQVFEDDEKAYHQAVTQIEAMEAQGDKLAKMGLKFKEYADLTPTAPATPAPQAGADLFLVILEGQKALSDSFDAVNQVLDGMKAYFDAKVAEMDAAKVDFEAKAKALQLRLDEKPRRIEDAATITDEKALEVLAQQSAGTEFDPAYPGMKVPLKH